MESADIQPHLWRSARITNRMHSGMIVGIPHLQSSVSHLYDLLQIYHIKNMVSPIQVTDIESKPS